MVDPTRERTENPSDSESHTSPHYPYPRSRRDSLAPSTSLVGHRRPVVVSLPETLLFGKNNRPGTERFQEPRSVDDSNFTPQFTPSTNGPLLSVHPPRPTEDRGRTDGCGPSTDRNSGWWKEGTDGEERDHLVSPPVTVRPRPQHPCLRPICRTSPSFYSFTTQPEVRRIDNPNSIPDSSETPRR